MKSKKLDRRYRPKEMSSIKSIRSMVCFVLLIGEFDFQRVTESFSPNACKIESFSLKLLT